MALTESFRKRWVNKVMISWVMENVKVVHWAGMVPVQQCLGPFSLAKYEYLLILHANKSKCRPGCRNTC